jgi:hypothetical protein
VLGQDIWSAVSALIGTAGSVAGSALQAKAAQASAKVAADMQRKMAEAAAAKASAEAAAASALARAVPRPPQPTGFLPGLPSLAIPAVLVLALIGGIIFVVRK